jgi:hypothetical protein
VVELLPSTACTITVTALWWLCIPSKSIRTFEVHVDD